MKGIEVFCDIVTKLNSSKPKGRPRKANKKIKFSCTLTPSQIEWIIKTADERGIERSELLRECVDKMMSNLAKNDEK